LLGFNNNVRHKGKVFHIQTEDSGIKHPHVITHLFADGGRILKSTKTSYAEHVGSENLAETVRALMKEQHKAMFIALRDGVFDSFILEPSAASSEVPSSKATPEIPKPLVDKPSGLMPVPSVASLAASESSSSAEIFERAAQQVQESSPVFQSTSDLPPPPATVLAQNRPRGSYRAFTPAPPPVEPVAAPESQASAQQQGTGRYVASRPAAIFATARPFEGGTVFGEDLISDKSLDDVILAFLSEEFGTAPGKEGEGNKGEGG
jgi:hypothetical protein